MQMLLGGKKISADQIFTIIKQDLEVAKKALDEDKFEFLSFASNRIMTNLLVADDVKLMLLGYMIRELAGELSNLKRAKGKDYANIKTESKSYLVNLQTQVDLRNIDPKTYFNSFCNMEERLRGDLLHDMDGTAYDLQEEFAKQFSIKFIDIAYSKKHDIEIKNIISRIAFELGRNFNQHGGREALVIYLVFKALNDYCSYLIDKPVKNEHAESSTEIENISKSKLPDYLDRINRLKSFITSLDKLYEESNLIIDDIGRDARILYLSRGSGEQEILLSEEARKKIDKIIQKDSKPQRK